MTIQEFFDTWNGKGLDFDGAYKNQCVDVFKQFNQEVVKAPNVNGNAIDYWTTYPFGFYDKISNDIKNFPQLGDVVIWGKTVGEYGHIAICKEGNADKFVSFDQNWPKQVDAQGNGTGVCHFQDHNYTGVLGWLRPKIAVAPTVIMTPITDQTKINMGDFGELEIQAVRSMLHDLKKAVDDLTRDVGGLQEQVRTLKDQQAKLSEKLGCQNSFDCIMGEVDKLITTEDQHNQVQPPPAWAVYMGEILKKIFGKEEA